MNRHQFWCAAGAVLLIVASLEATSLPAAEPRDTGLNELVIYDPGVHEKGLPEVQVRDGQVEIPPTLHIHRYYYSGNKEYQGPIISGGPTIVVARHPVTGEQLYIDVMLPAGTPVIAYNNHSITYVYPNQRLKIEFSRLFPEKISIRNLPGRGVSRVLRDGSTKVAEGLRSSGKKSSLLRSLKETVIQRKDVVVGAVGVVGSAAGFVVDKFNQAVQLIPGVQMLESAGKQAKERGSVEEIRQAGLEQAAEARQFLPTIR